jgi:hypothetical protein
VCPALRGIVGVAQFLGGQGLPALSVIANGWCS